MLHFLGYESDTTNPRCGFCHRVMADIGTFTTSIWHCPHCDNQQQLCIEPYDRRLIYVTPDGNIAYHYHEYGVWMALDNDARAERVEEIDLPGDLILWDDYREQQRARQRITDLYGDIEQLSLLEPDTLREFPQDSATSRNVTQCHAI
jgi:phage FluMu protein Com